MEFVDELPNGTRPETSLESLSGPEHNYSALQPIRHGPAAISDIKPSDAREDCVLQLWNLQLSLCRLSTHVASLFNISVANLDVAKDCCYPICEILENCDRFLQIVEKLERSVNLTAGLDPSIESISQSSAETRSSSKSQTSTADLSMQEHTEDRHDFAPSSAELDIPTLCMVLTCYRRITQIFCNFFGYLEASLVRYFSDPEATLQTFPSIRVGGFQPLNLGDVSIIVLVQMSMHTLTRVVIKLGLPDQIVTAVRNGKHGLVQPIIGVLSGTGGMKLVESMVAHGKEGDGGPEPLPDELHTIMKRVKNLSEQMMFR